MEKQFTVKIERHDGVEVELHHIAADKKHSASIVALKMIANSKIVSSVEEPLMKFHLKYIPSESNERYDLLDASGKVLNSFSTQIYSSRIAIQVSKNIMIGIAMDKKSHGILIFTSNSDVAVCEECCDTNVDVKAWVNQRNGDTSEVEEPDNQDVWCNTCQEHHNLNYRKPKPEGEVVYMYNHVELKKP